MDTQSISHTADYLSLDSALKSRWSPLLKLENEINEFVPKPLSEYSEYRELEMTRYRELNLQLSPLDLYNTKILYLLPARHWLYFQPHERQRPAYVVTAHPTL